MMYIMYLCGYGLCVWVVCMSGRFWYLHDTVVACDLLALASVAFTGACSKRRTALLLAYC